MNKNEVINDKKLNKSVIPNKQNNNNNSDLDIEDEDEE